MGTARFEPATSCLQSQIGQASHLWRRGNVQVEAIPALSVIIRWGPVRTAANGTLVARLASTTLLKRGSDGRQLGRWVRPGQGDTSLVGKGRRPAAAWVGLEPSSASRPSTPQPQDHHRLYSEHLQARSEQHQDQKWQSLR